MQVRDYPGLIDQVARVLRPGGLFLACEWGRFPLLHDGRNPQLATPFACAFFAAVNDALRARGVLPDAAQRLDAWLAESGYFERIRPRQYAIPIGDWPADEHLLADPDLQIAIASTALGYCALRRSPETR